MKCSTYDFIFQYYLGKDNYPADIKDDGEDFEAPVKNFDGTQKNVGYYHRYFDTGLKDAMGNTKVHRGFGDDFLFAAANKQKKVANITLERCTKKKKGKPSVCKEFHQKWSYAIPLEVMIYFGLLSSHLFSTRSRIPYSHRNSRPLYFRASSLREY